MPPHNGTVQYYKKPQGIIASQAAPIMITPHRRLCQMALSLRHLPKSLSRIVKLHIPPQIWRSNKRLIVGGGKTFLIGNRARKANARNAPDMYQLSFGQYAFIQSDLVVGAAADALRPKFVMRAETIITNGAPFGIRHKTPIPLLATINDAVCKNAASVLECNVNRQLFSRWRTMLIVISSSSGAG